jgi:hypothetical protein
MRALTRRPHEQRTHGFAEFVRPRQVLDRKAVTPLL